MQNSIKINVSRPALHANKIVRCGGLPFQVPLPLDCHFLSLVEEIVFNKNYEQLLAIVSKKKDEVSTIEQFYKLQAQSSKYFNIGLELNYDHLSLNLLSESEKLINELDKFQLNDLLILFKKSYDSFANKVHNKFNRRLKKYLSISQRSEQQRKQIKQLIQIIKSQSSEQQPEVIQQPIKNNRRIKVSPEKIKKIEQAIIKSNNDKQKGKKNDVIQVKSEVIPEKINKTEQVIPKQNKDNKKGKKNDVIQDKAVVPLKIKQEVVQEIVQKKQDKKKNFKDSNTKKPENKKDEDQNEWQDVDDTKETKFKKDKPKKNEFFHQKNLLKENQDEVSQEDDEQPKQQASNSARYRDKPQRRYKQGNNDSYNRNSRSKQKPNKDMRVILGINGANEDSWRQRNRVERIPIVKNQQKKTNYKAEKNNDFPYKQKKAVQYKINEEVIKQEQIKMVKASSKSGQLKKLFSFPRDGKKYKLDKRKLYKIKVNEIFWVSIQADQIIIQKENSGWIRSKNFQSNEDFILEADDITLSLEGTCNLQDGGIAFNNPKTSDFTKSESQWFNIEVLEVYSYE